VTTAARPTAAMPTVVVSAAAAPVAAALGTLQHQTCVRIFTDFSNAFSTAPHRPASSTWFIDGRRWTAHSSFRVRAFECGRGTISKFQDHANLFEFLLTSIDYIKFN